MLRSKIVWAVCLLICLLLINQHFIHSAKASPRSRRVSTECLPAAKIIDASKNIRLRLDRQANRADISVARMGTLLERISAINRRIQEIATIYPNCRDLIDIKKADNSSSSQSLSIISFDSNLLINPGFESGLTNWKKTTGTDVKSSSNFLHSGARSAVTTSTLTKPGQVYQSFLIGNSSQYYAAVWVKKLNSPQFAIKIPFYDVPTVKLGTENSHLLGLGTLNPNPAFIEGDWQLFEGFVSKPSGARSARLQLILQKGLANKPRSKIFLDDSWFSQVAEPTDLGTPTPTSVPTNTATIAIPPTVTLTATATATLSATATRTPTRTATVSATSTANPTVLPTTTATATATRTSTSTATASPTNTATRTSTATVSATITVVATVTATSTGTATATRTSTPSASATATATRTSTPTSTQTGTSTPSSGGGGSNLYVDSNIVSSSCTNYSPASRTCSGGSARAYKTIAGASAVTAPGDVVQIRAGNYAERLVPARSGTAANPITYARYAGETVSLSGSGAYVIDLSNLQYITVDGLQVDNRGWLEASNAQHLIVQNCRFTRSPAGGTTGNVRFVTSSYNQILNNVIEDGNDNLVLIDSDRNLVSGNTIRNGRHSVWGIRCGNMNIIRNNYFENNDTDSGAKIGEMYDCGQDTTAVNNKFDATKYNVVEGNIFAFIQPASNDYSKNGIQFSAQNSIVRKNVFYNNGGGALGVQLYSDEAEYVKFNRIYNNVMYQNSCGGTATSDGSSSEYTDNIFKNNAYAANKDCNANQNIQLIIGSPNGVRFESNSLYGISAGQNIIDLNGSLRTLAQVQSSNPSIFAANIEVNPNFLSPNAPTRDFHLSSSSALIDAGTFLTKTATAGSGTQLQVLDVGYFSNGFGAPGASGDVIQLQGQSATAIVIAIDYTNKILTLDHTLNWNANQGVALAYGGSAPDIGAFETAGSGNATPIPTPSASATSTASPSATPANTPTSTATRTATPSSTPTNTPGGPTITPTSTPTSTRTATPTTTRTATPTITITPTPTPTPITSAAGCGNGIIEEGEWCDDGNIASGDGCSNICWKEGSAYCYGQPSICVSTSWQPPIGIPDPRDAANFGGFDPIQGQAPALPNPWNSNVAGFFYVKQGGTNSGNGYPSSPRGSIPATLAAGSVVIMDSTALYTNTGNFVASGTAAQPVWIKGLGPSQRGMIARYTFLSNSHYLVFDNIWFRDQSGTLTTSNYTSPNVGRLDISDSDHIVIRNSEISGSKADMWGGVNFDSGNNLILYNNYFHDTATTDDTVDHDDGGFWIGPNSQNIWHLDSLCVRNGRSCSNVNPTSYPHQNSLVRRVFIGRVVGYHNREVNFSSKELIDGIWSQNISFNAIDNRPGNDPYCMGFQYGPANIWYLLNIVHGCPAGGIHWGSDDGGVPDNAYFIGNLAYDIPIDPYHPYGENGIGGNGGKNIYMLNNTVPGGEINLQGSNGGQHYIYNNITTSINDPFASPSQGIRNNMVSTMASGTCTNCMNYNPQFVNANAKNFRLQSTSPAVNSGYIDSIYSTVFSRFQTSFGIDLQSQLKDLDGIPRPQGSAIDLGAYEYH